MESPETRNRILNAAHELFLINGIRNVTMDEIAKQFAGSKKTLYQYFEDKNEIVIALVSRDLSTHQDKLKENRDKAANAIEEIFGFSMYMSEVFKQINSTLFTDILTFFPEGWRLIKEFNGRFVLELIEQNIKRGMNEGLYRNEINIPIIARLRIREVEVSIDQTLFPVEKFSVLEIYLQLLDHFLHGLLSLKGHKIVNQIKKTEE